MKQTKHTSQRGQGMTEYLVIVALIAVSAITIVKTTGSSVKVAFGKVASSLQGETYNGAGLESVTQAKTEGRNFKDFDKGNGRD